MAMFNASKFMILNYLFQSLYFITFICPTSGGISHKNADRCPLWHVQGPDAQCKCGDSHNGIVSCIGNFLYIKHGNCMTWNNSTKQAELQSCLLSQWNFSKTCQRYIVSDTYRIPANLSGRDLNYIMCKGYNR